MRQTIIRVFRQFVDRHGTVLVRYRSILILIVQLGLIAAANLSAFALRFDGEIPPGYGRLLVNTLPIVLLIFGSGFFVFGIQHGLWRYVGLHDLGRILWASVASAVVLFGVLHLLLGLVAYPRSVIILTGLLGALYLAGIRLAVRWFREWAQVLSHSVRRVLVVGAGNAGELLVRDMLSDARYHYRPVGMVDDDPVKRSMRIHGVPVAGGIEDISDLTRGLVVHEIIVAIPSASNALKRRILAASEGCKVPIKILPSVKQLLADPAALRQVRPMSLEDLLQREPVQTDRQELHPLLDGKRVLVTGAGGSIGSELCRQIAEYRPALLILFDRYENSLHALDLELRKRFPRLPLLSIVGDVTVPERVAEVFDHTRPELVFHAAAHKHVPLMELNPKEAVRNNVMGTRTVAEAALAGHVDRFILISTDKAVNPTSVMGATKRVAEEFIQMINRRGKTKCTVVRFGNVLGSNGSVVPLFAEQIRTGGPVTVTHPDITRFFMTIPEAVQLVLQASLLGQGGDVFVLDMGEQIKVADLAKNMIVLSGLVPEADIPIVYTGLRPGEKLFEELFEEEESVEPTSHEKIRRAVSRRTTGADTLDHLIARLEATLEHTDDEEVIRLLQEAIPTYSPMIQTGG
ncbi:putative polysaccharide biosynthesis protein EpsC [Nitrospira sp. KM1]|uniref:nucleoside-diphosphate sugar epimerase/dehydratase n=1 Tax=Nitrospira sp. KM1 TaxID=1936990 RepID=UPI0013A779F4|nr:nucleoside-diphosphate sugar epimerase/dehydratase [Nitrospira sp. KM1]BCA54200.1 putative polysaccharide biosynthesis protein EpsC [Nitrospira sp. KM1]